AVAGNSLGGHPAGVPGCRSALGASPPDRHCVAGNDHQAGADAATNAPATPIRLLARSLEESIRSVSWWVQFAGFAKGGRENRGPRGTRFRWACYLPEE